MREKIYNISYESITCPLVIKLHTIKGIFSMPYPINPNLAPFITKKMQKIIHN